jgi:hypothetical protein
MQFNKTYPLLVSIAFVLSGCVNSGDIILACSGVETEEKLKRPGVFIMQRDRVIEFKFRRQNDSLRNYFDTPQYSISGGYFAFEESDITNNETYISGRYTFQEQPHHLFYSKNTNLLMTTKEYVHGRESYRRQFEGICSKQSRIFK